MFKFIDQLLISKKMYNSFIKSKIKDQKHATIGKSGNKLSLSRYGGEDEGWHYIVEEFLTCQDSTDSTTASYDCTPLINFFKTYVEAKRFFERRVNFVPETYPRGVQMEEPI